MAQIETWKNIGNKIRHLRKMNQLTIRQLAKGCDLSANAISLVERGEVAPSVATLCKIAHALGVSASSLFQEVCSPGVVLSRAGEVVSTAGVDRLLGELSCASPRAVRPALLDRAEAMESDPYRRFLEGVRQSVLCLSGCVILEVDDQSYCLEPGDQLSFNAQAFHRWHNPGASASVAVVILPPDTTLIRDTGD
jgi:transcriptional regulator with XRE-family HTH domain